MESPHGPITVSTLAEARYFADGGFKDILYGVGVVPSKLAAITDDMILPLKLARSDIPKLEAELQTEIEKAGAFLNAYR